MDTKTAAGDAKTKFTPKSFDLIPKFIDKKITIRLVSGGLPINGILESYNPYELLLRTAKGELVVFKHAVATIEETTK